MSFIVAATACHKPESCEALARLVLHLQAVKSLEECHFNNLKMPDFDRQWVLRRKRKRLTDCG